METINYQIQNEHGCSAMADAGQMVMAIKGGEISDQGLYFGSTDSMARFIQSVLP